MTNQCGGPWSGGTVTFVGPVLPAEAGVNFGSATGPTTATATTDAGGTAVSPVPFANSVPGPLTVEASVASPGVGQVPFTLVIDTPPPPGGTIFLPTGWRMTGAAADRFVRLAPGHAAAGSRRLECARGPPRTTITSLIGRRPVGLTSGSNGHSANRRPASFVQHSLDLASAA